MNIEIKNLKKSFGKNVLFNDLNLMVDKGKVTCIYGVSGCGKTTLLDIIGLIQKYDSGIVLYDGKEVKNKSKKLNFLRKKIGFIFQDYGLIENETVEENIFILYKVKKNKENIAKLKEILRSINLDENIIKRKVYELSGGEQQRVTIAKLLLKDPDIILADEPTASLDEENRDIVLEFLKKLSRKGKTVIIVSHEKYIAEFSDTSIDLMSLK